MPKLSNGTLLNLGKWAIAILFSAGAVYGVVHFRLTAVEANITEVKPEVKQNTEHRIKFEEKVITMEKNIGLILVEVRK